MARDETTPFADTSNSAAIRESQSTSSPSDSSEAIAVTSSTEDGEALRLLLRPRTRENRDLGESLAASLPADESGLNRAS